MRLATIDLSYGPTCAVELTNSGFLPVTAAARARGLDEAELLDGGPQALIEGSDAALRALAPLVASARHRSRRSP